MYAPAKDHLRTTFKITKNIFGKKIKLIIVIKKITEMGYVQNAN